MKHVIKDLAAVNAVSWGTIAEKIDENFSELENSIPEEGEGGGGLDESQLEEYLTNNEYAKKSDIPSVPTKVSELQNDAKYVKETELKTINGKSIVGSGDITEIIGNTQKPKPIILDTDWWTDIDDAVAIKLMVWAEREGLCDILGLIVDAVNSNSAQSLARYLDYLGRGDLPFALEKNATDYSGSPSYFSTMISSWSYGIYSSNDECPDENEGEYYISLLQSLPDDEKCNIVCIGYLSALAGLFNKAKENQSIYNLIVNKVDKVFLMAGKYPSGSENNFTRNARSRQAGYDVCTNCPTEIPLIFLGYEVGETVRSGGTTGEVIGEFDLLYKGMVAHGEGASGRSSWDPMTMLLALIDNPNMSGYTYIRGTNAVDASTGANVFTENEEGNHYYVVKKYADAWYAHQINSIVEQRAWKFRELGRVQYNAEPIVYTLQSIEITTNPQKMTYYAGEAFNISGMVVTATMQNENVGVITKSVYDYTYTPSNFTEVGVNTVTISYTLNGVTKTASLEVEVKEAETFDILVNVTNGTYSGDEGIVTGGTASVTIEANENYTVPSTVTVTGADYSYNKSTGVITLSNPTSAVSIVAECIEAGVTTEGYGTITLDGSEDWQFNTSNEPNSYGYYNAYILSPNVVNPALGGTNNLYFAEASCDIEALNRNAQETRDLTTSGGIGYYKTDPSFFLRFNNTIATSIDTLKAWLAENKPTITYKQAE